jgi:hypothetical protein
LFVLVKYLRIYVHTCIYICSSTFTCRSAYSRVLLYFCCIAFVPVAQLEHLFQWRAFVCERAMCGWTLERLFAWYAQWTALEWEWAIDESEWTRLEWALWWNNELRMAQEESDRLWAHAAEHPYIVLNPLCLQWVVGNGIILQEQ